MRSRWRWWVVLVVVIGVTWPVGAIVVGRRLWATHRSGPPLPQVTGLLPTLDRTIADVAAAVRGDAAIALAGLTLARLCHVDGRAGAVYTRNLDIYLAHGDEDRLVTQIADRLPATYRPHRAQPVGGTVGVLSATPGAGVRLTVRQLGEGWLTATAETDCRASGADSSEPAASPEPAAVTTVDAILTRLHTHAAQWSRRELMCPTGTVVTTVVISAPTDNDGLPAKLADIVPATAHEYPSGADRLAYGDGSASVVVAPTDEGGAVTVRYTIAC